jgi:hypothetical protein
MNHLAPLYNSVLDQTADVLLQFVCRINIRDATSDRPCLIIVFDSAQADKLQRVMSDGADDRIPIFDPADIVSGWKPATVISFVPDADLLEQDEKEAKRYAVRRNNSRSSAKAAQRKYAESFGNLLPDFERTRKALYRCEKALALTPDSHMLKDKCAALSATLAEIRHSRKA